MIVFIYLGMIPEKDEFVGMAAVTEGESHTLSHRLRGGDEPAFGALPGVEVAVKSRGSKGAIAQTEEQVARTQRGCEARLRRGGEVAVVAVGCETGRGLPGKAHGLGPGSRQVIRISILGIAAEAAGRLCQPKLAGDGRSSNKVHRSTHGVGAIKRRSAAVEDLHPLDRGKRNRQIEIVMVRLRVIDADRKSVV